jgi:hypothetical protein
MSSAGKEHRYACLGSCRDYLFITHASARLDDCRDPCCCEDFKAIGKWEESI